MQFFLQLIIMVIMVCTSTLGLAAQALTRDLPAIIASGEIRIGMSLQTPWVIRDQQGELIGAEPDMAKRLAADLGVKPILTLYTWPQMIAALNRGEIDVIASGMGVTTQRALKVNFSQSYATSGVGLATHIGLTKKFKSAVDLQSPKVKIGAVTGTLAEDVLKRIYPQANLQSYATLEDLRKALLMGDLHGAVAAIPEPLFMALDNPAVIDQPLSKPLLMTSEAFAVRKSDSDLLHFLNAWVVAHQDDGWIPSTRHYWFETLRWRDQVIQ